MRRHIAPIIQAWLPMAFLATVVCGLVYASVQQDYRQSANDPQVQMAEDAAAAAEHGVPAPSLVPPTAVDIAQSLSPYLVFYDAQGAPASGNGLLSGQLPHLPQGVFAYTKAFGEDRFTWQPENGVRHAVVLVRIGGVDSINGFVMAGRSIREVEVREDRLFIMTFAAWLAALVGTLVLDILFYLLPRPRAAKSTRS